MSEFNVHKWFKNQYLKEAGILEEEKLPMPSPAVFYAIHEVLKNFLDEKAVEAGDRMSYFSAEFPLSSYFENYMRKQLEGLTLEEDLDIDFDDEKNVKDETSFYDPVHEALTLGDLELGKNFKKGSSLPFPNSDASKVINRQEDLDDYVAQFGADTEIVMGRFGRYEVPEFEAGREEAAATKAAGIKKFGTSA